MDDFIFGGPWFSGNSNFRLPHVMAQTKEDSLSGGGGGGGYLVWICSYTQKREHLSSELHQSSCHKNVCVNFKKMIRAARLCLMWPQCIACGQGGFPLMDITAVMLFLQCNSTLALGAFLSNVSVGSDKIAVIGCGCSVATEAVAAISSFWNITHVCLSDYSTNLH